MFQLAQPSMALNSHDVPAPDYKMWNTYKVSESTTADQMLGWTATVARGVEGGLRNMVINCHGKPGRLLIGTGITPQQVESFKSLAGKVNTIFIIACRVALMKCPGDCGGYESFDGNVFCSEIAKASQATVFCSTAFQDTGAYGVIGLPDGSIDEFEGSIYRYNRDGSCTPVTNEVIEKYVRKQRLGLK